MRTSFHHQPEAQHPNFPLSTSRQADYPIFRGIADMKHRIVSIISAASDPQRSSAGSKFRSATVSCTTGTSDVFRSLVRYQSPEPGFGEKYRSLSAFPSHSFQSGGGAFLT